MLPNTVTTTHQRVGYLLASTDYGPKGHNSGCQQLREDQVPQPGEEVGLRLPCKGVAPEVGTRVTHAKLALAHLPSPGPASAAPGKAQDGKKRCQK
jgi:hypothetical protein